jgi:hypothetical protein
MVTGEKDSGVTQCQGCGGEGVEIGFSLLPTGQKQSLGKSGTHPQILRVNLTLWRLDSANRGFDSLNMARKRIIVAALLRKPVGFREGIYLCDWGRRSCDAVRGQWSKHISAALVRSSIPKIRPGDAE